MRVLTFIKSDLDSVKKIIEKEFEVLKGPDDKAEKLSIHEFGYRSIHYIVKLNQKRAELSECREYKDFRAEIQIRTIIENAWAEIEHHWNYKPDTEDDQLDEKLQRRLNGLMAVLELVDREFDSIRESYQDKFKSDEIMLNTISELARSPNLFEDICKYLFENERYEELVYFIKEAVIEDENNRKALRNMAQSLIKLDKYEEALEILEKLISLEPYIAVHYIRKGIAFFELGKHLNALICYDKALKLEPRSAIALFYKGMSLVELENFEEAETTYQEALDILIEFTDKDPKVYQTNISITLNNLGILYMKLKKFEEAETAYQKALEIDSSKGTTWYNKACLESLKNIKEKAIEYLKRAIELDKKYIELAKSDKDFDNIRNSKEFKKIIGE